MRFAVAGFVSVVAFALAACAPRVYVTELDGTFEPRDGLDAVAVYTTQVPECPYREIAIVTAYQADILLDDDLDKVLAALKERARLIGADAVVGVRVVDKSGESARVGYSGTAIRFTDDECRQ